jgi:hypothetical protein
MNLDDATTRVDKARSEFLQLTEKLLQSYDVIKIAELQIPLMHAYYEFKFAVWQFNQELEKIYTQ